MAAERLQLIFETLFRGRSGAQQVKRTVRDIQTEAKRASAAFKGLNSQIGGRQVGSFFGSRGRVFADQTRRAKELSTALKTVGTTGGRAGRQLGTSFARSGESITGSIVKAQLFIEVLTRGLRVVKNFAKESTLLAASNETLRVVTNRLSIANELPRDKVFGVVEAVKSKGITTRVALDTVNRMIFAQLDLAKAADLALLGQNAAVIARENSSQTLQRLIFGRWVFT